jgi:hypothetical protein
VVSTQSNSGHSLDQWSALVAFGKALSMAPNSNEMNTQKEDSGTNYVDSTTDSLLNSTTDSPLNFTVDGTMVVILFGKIPCTMHPGRLTTNMKTKKETKRREDG